MILQEMLTYKRPGRSRAERKFIRRYIAPLGAEPDGFGNYILRIGTAPVLWACHTDTVHKSSGRQRVFLSDKGTARSDGDCLGADDTTGVWLLCELARQGVEGLYIFHRDEETGMQGSAWIAENTPELLDGIKYAIAFDRCGYDSIVTHQCGEKTASDQFAEALAEGLALGMKPDPTGVYTDTLSYAQLIPECTNVSVGYHHAHSASEAQNTGFAGALLRALLRLDVATLPAVRDPAAYEMWDDDDGYGWRAPARDYAGIEQLYQAILDDPGAAAEVLFQAGYTADDIRDVG